MYIRWILILGLAANVVWADSLFSRRAAEKGSLISNRRPEFTIGDIITVTVNETIDAQTDSNTNTRKESEIEAQAPVAANQFLVAETKGGLNIIPQEQLPNWNIDVENEHRTIGNTKRKNRLVTNLSCVVTEVLNNGTLRIEGERKVTVNREDSTLHVSGLIRAKDVAPGNTIQSRQIANAVVQLKGAGPLWNNQRRGILTRILDWFSPF
ncbi:MAG: flagellar basal body L-ring protein FlgH [Candidatus Hydrogenedentes bacterium]|nr:flagellar basal body L-ring protein FlgH [Candidatus Hydrogenedentota bacterium]